MTSLRSHFCMVPLSWNSDDFVTTSHTILEKQNKTKQQKQTAKRIKLTWGEYILSYHANILFQSKREKGVCVEGGVDWGVPSHERLLKNGGD